MCRIWEKHFRTMLHSSLLLFSGHTFSLRQKNPCEGVKIFLFHNSYLYKDEQAKIRHVVKRHYGSNVMFFNVGGLYGEDNEKNESYHLKKYVNILTNKDNEKMVRQLKHSAVVIGMYTSSVLYRQEYTMLQMVYKLDNIPIYTYNTDEIRFNSKSVYHVNMIGKYLHNATVATPGNALRHTTAINLITNSYVDAKNLCYIAKFNVDEESSSSEDESESSEESSNEGYSSGDSDEKSSIYTKRTTRLYRKKYTTENLNKRVHIGGDSLDRYSNVNQSIKSVSPYFNSELITSDHVNSIGDMYKDTSLRMIGVLGMESNDLITKNFADCEFVFNLAVSNGNQTWIVADYGMNLITLNVAVNNSKNTIRCSFDRVDFKSDKITEDTTTKFNKTDELTVKISYISTPDRLLIFAAFFGTDESDQNNDNDLMLVGTMMIDLNIKKYMRCMLLGYPLLPDDVSPTRKTHIVSRSYWRLPTLVVRHILTNHIDLSFSPTPFLSPKSEKIEPSKVHRSSSAFIEDESSKYTLEAAPRNSLGLFNACGTDYTIIVMINTEISASYFVRSTQEKHAIFRINVRKGKIKVCPFIGLDTNEDVEEYICSTKYCHLAMKKTENEICFSVTPSSSKNKDCDETCSESDESGATVYTTKVTKYMTLNTLSRAEELCRRKINRFDDQYDNLSMEFITHRAVTELKAGNFICGAVQPIDDGEDGSQVVIDAGAHKYMIPTDLSEFSRWNESNVTDTLQFVKNYAIVALLNKATRITGYSLTI